MSNTTESLLESAQFWTYLPVPQTSHQRVMNVAANYPYRIQHDEHGNSSIHFELADIPPYGSKVVSITVDMLMSDFAVPLSVGDQAKYLSPEPRIQSENSKIRVLAEQLQDALPSAMARNDFEWVKKNIVAEGFIAEDMGAIYAIENRKGDCTEFSYLLTALYRAQKIPARAVGGYVFPGNGVVSATDYHNWTEFYQDGAWQIADALNGLFLDRQRDLLALTEN